MQIPLRTLRRLIRSTYRPLWVMLLILGAMGGLATPMAGQPTTPTPVPVEIFLPVISEPGETPSSLIGSPIGPVEEAQGQIHQAMDRDFGNYLLTNDNLTYGLVGATVSLEQQIATLRDQDPPTTVLVSGMAYAIVDDPEVPVIVVERIVSTRAVPTATLLAPPMATASFSRINLRVGPDDRYGQAGQIVRGQQCTIVGRNRQSSWWELVCNGQQRGWIDGRLVTISGNVAAVPITEPAIVVVVTPTATVPATATPAPTAVPVTPTPAPPPVNAWRATYFANNTLQDPSAAVEEIGAINFSWGANPPLAQLPADNFSARFERIINFSQGYYRFSLNADDGVRFWIDDELLLDEWHGTTNRTYVVGRTLAGNHTLRIEYYEANGLASLRLLTEFVSAFPEWEATYFANSTLDGAPVFTQLEARSTNPLDYTWGTASPLPGRLGADNWSARWEGAFRFDFATYVFRAQADDGVRVYINNQIILDHWRDGYKDVTNRFYSVGAGIHTIRVEFYERTGDASVRVWWYADPNAPR